MKTLYTLLFVLIISTCSGQSWLTASFDMTPNTVFDLQDIIPKIGFKFGSDMIRVGGDLSLNDAIGEMYFGIYGEGAILNRDWIDVFVPLGFAARVEQDAPPSKHETDFHKWYIHYGLRFDKNLTEHFTVNCHIQNQNYGQKIVKVFGVGGSYALK